jgi:hypothetical protein
VEVAPPGLVRVSSLSVRNAVLHDLTAVDDDDDAIRYQIQKHDQTIRQRLNPCVSTTLPFFCISIVQAYQLQHINFDYLTFFLLIKVLNLFLNPLAVNNFKSNTNLIKLSFKIFYLSLQLLKLNLFQFTKFT